MDEGGDRGVQVGRGGVWADGSNIGWRVVGGAGGNWCDIEAMWVFIQR